MKIRKQNCNNRRERSDLLFDSHLERGFAASGEHAAAGRQAQQQRHHLRVLCLRLDKDVSDSFA